MAVLAKDPGYTETEHMGHDFKRSFIRAITDQAAFAATGAADSVDLEIIYSVIVNIL